MVKRNEKSDEPSSQTNEPDASLLDEESFVILGQSRSIDSQVNSLTNSQPASMLNNNGAVLPNTESMGSSFLTGCPNSSYEDIQSKLQALLQENFELKETLKQNNLAMKEQFNTLVMWQEEVFKVHQSHKEKFQETRDLILKLKAENADLKSQIAELTRRLSMPSPRKDRFDGGMPSKKEQELSALAEKLNNQLETAERSRRQLTDDNEKLTFTKGKLEKELAETKAVCDAKIKLSTQLQAEINGLRDSIAKQEQETKEFVFVEEKTETNMIKKLQSVLDEERKAVVSLRQQLNELKVCSSPNESDPNSETVPAPEKFEHELVRCCKKLKDISIGLDIQNDRYSSLSTWLQVTTENNGQHLHNTESISDLKLELEELKKLFATEQAISLEKQKQLSETQNQFQKLFFDHQSLLKEWEIYTKEQATKEKHDGAYYEAQMNGFKEKIDKITAQLMEKSDSLADKCKEVKELREKVKHLEDNNETIGILKAQVEVYQSDFNAERSARENLAGEKERLAEDLRHLHHRNEELLKTIEDLQRKNGTPSPQQRHSSSSSRTGNGWNTIATPAREASNSRRMFDEEIPRPTTYTCPSCNMAFRRLDLLELHVVTCLNLTD